jgi:hypothetical protein
MHKTLIFAAAAGLTFGSLGASGASAMTSASPAGVRAAAEAMDSSALVHCRPYRHWHPWGYSRGCGGGTSVEIRRGHRVGVEERERTSIHSRTTTRGETSVRGSTSTKTGETKSSTSTTGKSGTSGKSSTSGGGTSGRAQGEKSSGGSSGGGTGGASGGTSGGTSGGQKQ